MARLATGLELRQRRRLAMTPGLRQSIRLLRMSNRDLAGYLEELAAENPWLELSADAAPAPPRAPAVAGGPPAALAGGSGGAAPQAETAPDAMAGLEAGGGSLYAHVLAGIEAAFPPGPDRDIALAFAEALEPSGWLGAGVEAVAARAGCDADRAAAVLARLQRFEPAGLFARSLAECLRLQAAEAGRLDPPMAAVLDNLDLLARGDLGRIARRAGVAEAEIAARVRLVRGFDPKPGARFADHMPVPAAAQPDLIAAPGADGGWEVTLNRASLPAIVLRPGDAGGDPAHAEARRLAQMVERRNATLLRVVAEVLRRQAPALEHGPERMRPLRRSDIAAALDLHESTVSRVLADLRIVTPRGSMALDEFFPAALAGEGSAAQARAAIRRLVGAEDRSAPLSDAALVGALAAEGLVLARRTVARYRALLRMPPASRRRKR